MVIVVPPKLGDKFGDLCHLSPQCKRETLTGQEIIGPFSEMRQRWRGMRLASCSVLAIQWPRSVPFSSEANQVALIADESEYKIASVNKWNKRLSFAAARLGPAELRFLARLRESAEPLALALAYALVEQDTAPTWLRPSLVFRGEVYATAG